MASWVPKHFDQVVMSWDTANKASELADYSVCTVWGYKKPHIYLLYVLRKKLEYPDLKKFTKELRAQWHPTKILIEDKASGTQLIQELRQEGMYAAKGVKPEGDKVMRMNAQTGFFEQGLVYLPVQPPSLEDYKKELISFPKGKHDDQVDSTAQALKWIHDYGQEPAFLTYIKEECRRMYGDLYY
jgi:predicted phage terminase large subunit-like protein